MSKDLDKNDYLIVTTDSAFKTNSIEEAIYSWGVKCATVFVPKNSSIKKDAYKYAFNIIVDEEVEQ